MKHLVIITLLLSLIACQSNEEKTSISNNSDIVSGILPKANGKAGNVLVSVDDKLWEGGLKAIFDTVFSKNAIGPFIHPEPFFDYLQQDPTVINQLGRKNRNFLRVILDDSKAYNETEVIVKKDHISEGQIYIVVKDSDKARLFSFFEKELPTYISVFDDQETERLVHDYSINNNFAFDKVAKKRFGISISVPSSADFKADLDSVIYALDKNSKTYGDNPDTGVKGGTYWAKKGIIIWESDFVDASSMLPSNLLVERDSTLKYTVKGTMEGTYMATEYYKTRKPVFTEIAIDGTKAIKIEGLWIHAGNEEASGGGPFIQYSIQHPTRNTIVHVSSYIFALHFEKRELIRQVNAILKTITIVD